MRLCGRAQKKDELEIYRPKGTIPLDLAQIDSLENEHMERWTDRHEGPFFFTMCIYAGMQKTHNKQIFCA